MRATLPIFQGGRAGALIRQSQARQSIALENAIATERDVIATTRASYSSWRAAGEIIASTTTAVAAAELSLEGVRAEQTVGNRTILDFLDAQQELLRAQVQLVTARRNAYIAGFTLLAAMGHAEARDLGLEEFGPLYDPVANYERVSTVLFQKEFSYSGGLELVATRERERDANGDLAPAETFFIAAVPLFAQLDSSDDLLDPTKGFRLGVRASPEVSRSNDMESFYLRGEVEGTAYLRASERIVIAARAKFASIPGAPVAAIAPSRRLYAGGGGSVRGYDYKGIGPHNEQGDPMGGRSLTELSLEARIRTGLLGGNLGIVPFIDAGTVGEDSTPSFDQIKLGAGIGARYLTSFGPLRIDVGVPLNPGPNDPKFGVYVGLGQSF